MKTSPFGLHFSRICLPLALLSLSMWIVGCEAKKVEKAGGGGSHEHSHAHEDGPHGGHMLDLLPDGGHAEWTHDDEKGVLTIYLEELVAAGKKVEKVRVDLALQNNETKSYDLKVSEADQHKIEGAIFSIVDPQLVTTMEVPGVKATLVVTADGKEFKGSLAHDHDHGHKH